jgi:hypothetical protein
MKFIGLKGGYPAGLFAMGGEDGNFATGTKSPAISRQ